METFYPSVCLRFFFLPHYDFHDCVNQQAQPANEDNVCDSKTLDIAEEQATRPSSGEDVAEKEIAPSNMELNTPCLSTEQRENILEKEADHVESFSQSDSSEGHSPATTATEVKHTPSDRQHKGVIHINHGPSTEQVRTTSHLLP